MKLRNLITLTLTLTLFTSVADARWRPFNRNQTKVSGVVCEKPTDNTVKVVLGNGETTKLDAAHGWKGIRKLSDIEVGYLYTFQLRNGIIVDKNRRSLDTNACALSKLLKRQSLVLPPRRLSAESCWPVIRGEISDTENSWAGAWTLALPYINRCLRGCRAAIDRESAQEIIEIDIEDLERVEE